jgi:hypothetical protein
MPSLILVICNLELSFPEVDEADIVCRSERLRPYTDSARLDDNAEFMSATMKIN